MKIQTISRWKYTKISSQLYICFSWIQCRQGQQRGLWPRYIFEFSRRSLGHLEQQSRGRLDGVDVSDGTTFFDGSNRLYIWRYQSYDYRDKLQISFKFKPVPGTRMEPYTLVSNCEGNDEPSYGIVLNSFSNITTIFLKTYEIENQRFMTFDINVRIY